MCCTEAVPERNPMSAIRVKHVPEFLGPEADDDAVLLAMDRAGLDDFLPTVLEAQRHGSALLQRPHRSHRFVLEDGAADITLTERLVVWRLARSIVDEIVVKLTSMRHSDRPCHHYVDELHTPAETLVLSLDEYIEPSWLTAGKQPIFGDEPE
jgi:hypothetical protein